MKSEYIDRLTVLIQSDSCLTMILNAVRQCDPPDWYVGAGVIRNLVWDHLHGYTEPNISRDVDVAFFDPDDLSPKRDAGVGDQLTTIQPDLPWEATNQAAVHFWYKEHFGQDVQPFTSCEEAIGTWPETVTAIGVRLLADDQLKICAPYGLADLFEMKLRRNPSRVSLERFYKRLRDKRILETWPQVALIDG